MNTQDSGRAWRATSAKAALWFLAISAVAVACDSATAPNVPEPNLPALPIPAPLSRRPFNQPKSSRFRETTRKADQAINYSNQ